MNTFMRKAAFVFLLSLATPLHALEISGANIPTEYKVAGENLKLNGAGIRTATVLKVRVYVAAFYSPTAIKTAEEALSSKGPLRFDFTFLRSFGEPKVEEAWDFTFTESGSYTYPTLDQDKKVFVKAFGPIKKMGLESVEIIGDETIIYDDNVEKGRIKGRDFQLAFLNLWFGNKPVMASLKNELLGKTRSK